tara:strand:+ start:71 stop:700 length:630 start_codon:yes stop_codon:yes gene_type:complete
MNLLFKKSLYSLVILLMVFCVFPSKVLALSEEAYFAGGCFWCLEHDFEDLNGVLSVESGYSGGEDLNPTYQNHDGYQESIRVSFDPRIVSYEILLRAYWRNIDPLDAQGQFCDRGNSYKSKIFVANSHQHELALLSFKKASSELGLTEDLIKVRIEEFKSFYIAENYHQNYAQNNALKYNFYRYSCGRDARLDELWGENARTSFDWSDN